MKAEDLAAENMLPEQFPLVEEDDFDDDESYEVAEFDDDDDDEAYAEFDDDDDDEADEAEFLGALAPVLGAVASPLIRGIGGAVSSIFRPRGKRVFRRYGGTPIGRGVRGATLSTPRGTARLRLPTSVVPMAQFRTTVRRLESRDNSLTNRLNRTQKDLSSPEKKAAQALTVATTNTTRFRRHSKRTRRRLAKLKKDADSKSTMNLIMSMMQQQNIESRLRDHTHVGSTAAAEFAEGTSQNQALMFLPLVMSGDSGGDDNMMMMLVMMQMMGDKGND